MCRNPCISVGQVAYFTLIVGSVDLRAQPAKPQRGDMCIANVVKPIPPSPSGATCVALGYVRHIEKITARRSATLILGEFGYFW